MTITLHWWLVPAALVIGALATLFWPRRYGDWDFVTPLFHLGIAVVAGAFTLGRWFA